MFDPIDLDFLFSFHLLETIILFIIISALFLFLFVREKSGETIIGVIKSIASFFYSPFVYIKNAFLELATFASKKESDYSGSKQYLLNKILLLSQTFLVILAILILTQGLIGSWNTFLPPKHIRDAISETNDKLDVKRDRKDEIEPMIEKMDEEWNSKREQLINDFKNQKEQIINQAEKSNFNYENDLSNDNTVSQLFVSIKNYLSQNEYYSNSSRFEKIKNDALEYVNRQDLAEAYKQSFRNYINNWHSIMINKLELKNLSETNLRNSVQPDYDNLKIEKEGITSTILYLERQLMDLEPQAKYNLGPFIIVLLATFLTFILYVWIIGLVIELLWLSVDIAANLRKIKEQKIIKSGEGK